MDILRNKQVKQDGLDLDPADGGSDSDAGATAGPNLGLKMVTGKGGYSQDLPVWGQQSTFTDYPDSTGSGPVKFGGQDSTDEYATYKRPQTDEGLPQTYRDSKGAGDAGPSGSDEFNESTDGNPDTQSVPSDSAGEHTLSDMPQTQFTHESNGGAPAFKFSGVTPTTGIYRPKPRT